MSIPDAVVGTYARLCTALHPREVAAIEAAVAAGGVEANQAKRRVAREVVTLYHGSAEADAAEDRFNAVFRDRQILADAPEAAMPDGDPVHVPALLVGAGLAASTSAARRDIDAGAVRVDGKVVPPRQYDLPRSDLVGKVIMVGKRKAARLIDAP
jgi:tyrosyl-tRNA synthetase